MSHVRKWGDRVDSRSLCHHSVVSGSVSLNPKSSVHCNKIFCPSLLQTATSDALAKYFCAAE